jgi:hypothetical protein
MVYTKFGTPLIKKKLKGLSHVPYTTQPFCTEWAIEFTNLIELQYHPWLKN